MQIYDLKFKLARTVASKHNDRHPFVKPRTGKPDELSNMIARSELTSAMIDMLDTYEKAALCHHCTTRPTSMIDDDGKSWCAACNYHERKGKPAQEVDGVPV